MPEAPATNLQMIPILENMVVIKLNVRYGDLNKRLDSVKLRLQYRRLILNDYHRKMKCIPEDIVSVSLSFWKEMKYPSKHFFLHIDESRAGCSI